MGLMAEATMAVVRQLKKPLRDVDALLLVPRLDVWLLRCTT